MQPLFEITQKDITQLEVDAIVNAANPSLLGGGGVDGAIHAVAGSALKEECRKIVKTMGPCQPGEAVLTSGYNLLAEYVIHTVGPVWKGGDKGEEDTLKKSYISVLELVVKHRMITIGFPNISTGVYGFPKPLAATIAIESVREYFKNTENRYLQKIYWVCFDQENYKIYQDLLANKE